MGYFVSAETIGLFMLGVARFCLDAVTQAGAVTAGR
jgi:hypothetical protein